MKRCLADGKSGERNGLIFIIEQRNVHLKNITSINYAW